jgi:hypothetical protein
MRFTTKRAQWIVLTKFSTMVKAVASVTPSHGDVNYSAKSTELNLVARFYFCGMITAAISRNIFFFPRSWCSSI